MTVHSLRWHSIYVAPVRLGLGFAWLFGARLAGANAASALLAFVSSAIFFVFLALNDPRARFLPKPEPQPLPPGAQIASPVRQALASLVPSTLGLSILAAIVVVPKPVLGAVLGGITAGLGVGGILHAYFADPDIFFDRGTGAVYRR